MVFLLRRRSWATENSTTTVVVARREEEEKEAATSSEELKEGVVLPGVQKEDTFIAISNLGTVLKAKGDLAAAEPLLRESRLAPRFLELTASTLQ